MKCKSDLKSLRNSLGMDYWRHWVFVYLLLTCCRQRSLLIFGWYWSSVCIIWFQRDHVPMHQKYGNLSWDKSKCTIKIEIVPLYYNECVRPSIRMIIDFVKMMVFWIKSILWWLVFSDSVIWWDSKMAVNSYRICRWDRIVIKKHLIWRWSGHISLRTVSLCFIGYYRVLILRNESIKLKRNRVETHQIPWWRIQSRDRIIRLRRCKSWWSICYLRAVNRNSFYRNSKQWKIAMIWCRRFIPLFTFPNYRISGISGIATPSQMIMDWKHCDFGKIPNRWLRTRIYQCAVFGFWESVCIWRNTISFGRIGSNHADCFGISWDCLMWTGWIRTICWIRWFWVFSAMSRTKRYRTLSSISVTRRYWNGIPKPFRIPPNLQIYWNYMKK